MKCPFCGSKGARVNGSLFDPDAMIHAAIDCLNVECSCYKGVSTHKHSISTGRRQLHPPGTAGTPIRFSRLLDKIHLRRPH